MAKEWALSTMDADVSPLVSSSPSDAVLEIDPETDFEVELNNITNIVIDTECITLNNSDCSTQNSVTNNAIGHIIQFKMCLLTQPVNLKTSLKPKTVVHVVCIILC